MYLLMLRHFHFVNTNNTVMLLGLPYDPFHDEDAEETPQQQQQQKLHQKLQEAPAKLEETPEKIETKEETIDEAEDKKKIEETEKVGEETEQDGERLGERVAKIEDFTGKLLLGVYIVACQAHAAFNSKTGVMLARIFKRPSMLFQWDLPRLILQSWCCTKMSFYGLNSFR